MTPQYLSLQGLYVRLTQACEEAGGQSAFARRHGISPGHVNDVLHVRREPGDAIIRALGLKKVTRYMVVGEQK